VTYSFVIDVPMPAELYHSMHAAIQEASGDIDHGLIMHIGRATDAGFQIIEVWKSQEHCERFVAEVAGPALARLSGGQPAPAIPQVEFVPLGLVVPAAGVSV
jgi:hypothetical protein